MSDSQGFSTEDKKFLLNLARNTIMNYLTERKKEVPESDNPLFNETRGVFVTLHNHGDLRGCIGYPLPVKPLLEAIVDNAVSSATEDHRFYPVTYEELRDIDIEISVLTVPKKVESYKDIVVGQDGIIVSKGYMKGLLLPQVPVEQKWDLETYISHGCLKAGLPADEWRRNVGIETFQGIVFGEKEL